MFFLDTHTQKPLDTGAGVGTPMEEPYSSMGDGVMTSSFPADLQHANNKLLRHRVCSAHTHNCIESGMETTSRQLVDKTNQLTLRQKSISRDNIPEGVGAESVPKH